MPPSFDKGATVVRQGGSQKEGTHAGDVEMVLVSKKHLCDAGRRQRMAASMRAFAAFLASKVKAKHAEQQARSSSLPLFCMMTLDSE